MNKRIYRALAFCLLGGFLAAAASVYAQERAVGGSLQTEASWSALSSMINATNGNVKTLRVEVNEIKKCGDSGKVWKAGTGCIGTDTSLYDKVVACGDKGQIYDKSADACINAKTTAPTCSFSSISATDKARNTSEVLHGFTDVKRLENQGYTCTYSSSDLLQKTCRECDATTVRYYICQKITCK